MGGTTILNLLLVESLVYHLEFYLERDPYNSVSFNKGKSTFYIKSNICIFF